MKKYHPLCFALSLGLAILAAPLVASAECIDVTPASWDYGDVEVGTSESQIITIHSCGATALNIGYLEVIKDETGAPSFAYEITSPIPDVPFSLQGSAHPDFPEGEILDIEITFTPPDVGAHEALLYIRHDANGGVTSVNLYGVGVSEEPEPGEVMGDLIEFFEASVEASKLRLRPILMTSFAFILGVVPLVLATGAGAEMRRALGIAVFSGMLGVTVFGVFLTPVFYLVIRWLVERNAPPKTVEVPTPHGPADASVKDS